MAEQKLLSVIIPVYNAARWLDECLQSILVSVHPDETQMILVNDGSTDESGKICDRYGTEYSFIRVFHKENAGVASARNLGLEHAQGLYTAWVDPDDRVSPDWFNRILGATQQGQPDVIVMDSVRFDAGAEEKEIYGRTPGFIDRDLFEEDLMRDIRMLSGLPNKVIKTKFFEGVTFDASLQVLEDFAAMPQILKNVQTVYYLPHCLYFYRQHPASLLHIQSPERAFQSVQTAYMREQNALPRFRPAAITATALQALYFCRNTYLQDAFSPKKEQVDFCVSYVRKHLRQLCRDQELPGHLKAKMMLLAANCYAPFVGLRSRKQQKREER